MKVSEEILAKLYNRKVKEAFLENYLEDDETRVSYAIYLNLASRMEKILGKDLYLFSRDDVLSLCSDNFTSSHTALRAFYSVCKAYVGYCTDQGYNPTMINPFMLVKFRQHILPMLNEKGLEGKYLSEEEIWDIKDETSINAQDFVCLLLPWYTIKGVKNSEIQKLRKSDVNEITNTVKLTEDDGSVREIELPRKVINVINEAWGQSEYQRRGREGFGGRCTAQLKPSDYIVRPTTVKGEDFATAQTISARVKKELIDAGHPTLSLNDIYMSSKLNKLKAIENEKGKLEIDDFKRIQFDFNDSTENYSNLLELYNILNPKAE